MLHENSSSFIVWVLSAMETTLTADKIKSWINESSMKSDQVDSVSVYVSMCDDKNNCNAMALWLFSGGKCKVEKLSKLISHIYLKFSHKNFTDMFFKFFQKF